MNLSIISNFVKENWKFLGLAIVLVALLISNTCNNSSSTSPDCVLTYSDSTAIADVINANTSITFESDDSPTPTDTIYQERVVYKEHTTFVKNWNELQDLKELYAEELEKSKSAYELVNKTRKEFEALKANGQPIIIETIETVVEPPIVRTEKNDSTDQYVIETSIHSKGQLEHFERKITVKPKTVFVTKTEKELYKRNNFIALKAGAFYMNDIENVYYSPSLEYGHKWWLLEAGPVLNQDFKYQGIEAKAGIVFKFK